MSLRELLRACPLPARESQMLAAHVLGRTRAWVIAHDDTVPTAEQRDALQSLMARRVRGEPFAYILGTREFYLREFVVSPSVLIPRPETEILIEQALMRLSGTNAVKTLMNRPLSLLDLGTGSGCIAITLALERPACQVTAIDASPDALAVAQTNANALGATVSFQESNWFSALEGQTFDMIVANPPYVADGDAHLQQGDLRFEPPRALTDNSADGLKSIRQIVSSAPRHLQNGGWLLIEHGYNQASDVRELFRANGFIAVATERDLAGIERVTLGKAVGGAPSSTL